MVRPLELRSGKAVGVDISRIHGLFQSTRRFLLAAPWLMSTYFGEVAFRIACSKMMMVRPHYALN